MNKQILESLYGIGGQGSNIDLTGDNVDQNAIRRDNTGRELAKSRDFDDESAKGEFFKDNYNFPLNARQTEIYNYFIESKDAFVSYPPSAGKTAPIEKGLSELFTNKLNNPSAIAPHILYVVPRKQLAAQVADDFRKKVFFKPLEAKFKIDFARNNPRVPRDQIRTPNSVQEQAYSSVAERTGGQKDPLIINFYDGYVPMVVATYESAKELITQGSYSHRLTHIIVDEVQELVSHPGEGINKGLEDRYASLVAILSNASKKTGIMLMTGSINQMSVRYLSDYFNSNYTRRFQVIPRFDPTLTPQAYGTSRNEDYEGQLLNRSNISLQPMKELSGYPTSAIPARLKLIKDIVVNRQFESVMIIFSKQRSGQGIFKMLEELINMLPPYPTGYFFEEDNEHVKQVIKNNGQGIRLDDSKNIEYLKYFDIRSVLSSDKEVSTGNVKDKNNILYQSVIRGIAPLVGPMNQLHKKIVQYYFTDNKKIHMILGTDALGIGANVKCRNLYIPTVFKFNGKSLERTDESSLVQLVHRAGRGSFSTANVYCAIEDYNYIRILLFQDPRVAVPELNTETLEGLAKLHQEQGKKGLFTIFKNAFNL